jgi:hypothetical protein
VPLHPENRLVNSWFKVPSILDYLTYIIK